MTGRQRIAPVRREYNRWVANNAAVYFSDAESFGNAVSRLLASPETLAAMRINSQRRYLEEFTWEHVAGQYEQLLLRYLPRKIC